MTQDQLLEILALIPEMGWETFSPTTIQEKLGCDLEDIPSKRHLLEAFHQYVSKTLQERLNTEDLKDAPWREQVMEVMLCRLEIIEPHKDALRRIYQDIKEDPCLLKDSFSKDFLKDQWLWEHITPPHGGIKGDLHKKAIGVVYWLTVRHFLKEKGHGLDGTMAFLHRTLDGVEGVF